METVEFSKAIEILVELILHEYRARSFITAFAYVHALAKLAAVVNETASKYVDDAIIREICDGPHRLQRQLTDPKAEVTPELFIAGIRKALIESPEKSARPSFEEMIMRMWGIQRRKGADYGSDEDPLANLKASEEWGTPGWENTFSRINDKRARIISFIKRRSLVNESAFDSFRDFAVYSVHMWRLFCEWLDTQPVSNDVEVEVGESIEVYSELDQE